MENFEQQNKLKMSRAINDKVADMISNRREEEGSVEPTVPRDILHEQALEYEKKRDKYIDKLEKLSQRSESKVLIDKLILRIRNFGNNLFYSISDEIDFKQKNSRFDPKFPNELDATSDGWSYSDKMQTLQSDIGLILKGVEIMPDLLEILPNELKKNKEIVLQAVSVDGRAIQYAAPILRRDPDVQKVAFAQNPEAVKLLDDNEIDHLIANS